MSLYFTGDIFFMIFIIFCLPIPVDWNLYVFLLFVYIYIILWNFVGNICAKLMLSPTVCDQRTNSVCNWIIIKTGFARQTIWIIDHFGNTESSFVYYERCIIYFNLFSIYVCFGRRTWCIKPLTIIIKHNQRVQDNNDVRKQSIYSCVGPRNRQYIDQE